MERRQFFRLGMDKALKAVVHLVDSTVSRQAGRWFRPPYAMPEMGFLLACTRCDKCIQACPHEVLFPLPMEMGVQVGATPAMDLLNHGCHLCAEWPCVRVCEAAALQLPEGQPPPLPRLAQVSIDAGVCLPYRGPECGACGSVCPVPGALRWEGHRPTVVKGVCVGCALCLEACPTLPKSVLVQPLCGEADV
jgi:ferredoxin-type protein NapG